MNFVKKSYVGGGGERFWRRALHSVGGMNYVGGGGRFWRRSLHCSHTMQKVCLELITESFDILHASV